MIATAKLRQNIGSGHLHDVTPGNPFWAAASDAAGLIAAGQAYTAPGGTAAPPPEPSLTVNGSPGFATGTSNGTPPAAALAESTADAGSAAAAPAGGYDGGNAGTRASGTLDGGRAT